MKTKIKEGDKIFCIIIKEDIMSNNSDYFLLENNGSNLLINCINKRSGESYKIIGTPGYWEKDLSYHRQKKIEEIRKDGKV